MSEKYIYALVHIPKTAGYTLRYHLIKNFKEEEMLHMSFDNLKLDGFNPPKTEMVFRDAAENYVENLNKKRRDKVKIIYGHLVHSDLEKYFDREIRYITFIREPRGWLYSVYRHWVSASKIRSNDSAWREHFRKILLVDGEIPNFSLWLEKRNNSKYLKNYSNMAGFLNRRGFSSDYRNKKESIDSLHKFYFVGLTENFSEESLYLYDLMGINKFFFDQNITRNDVNKNLKDKNVGKKYADVKDQNIYKAAIQINSDFKTSNSEYYKSVSKKRIQKKLFLPFAQTIFAPRKTMIRVYERIMYNEPLFK